MRTLFGTKFVEVGGALDAAAAAIEDLSANHCRPNISVAEEFPHGADIAARFDQLRREGVTKRVAAIRDNPVSYRGGNCSICVD